MVTTKIRFPIDRVILAVFLDQFQHMTFLLSVLISLSFVIDFSFVNKLLLLIIA